MKKNNKFKIRVFEENDRKDLVELWRDCDLVVPWNDPDKDIDMKITYHPQGLLVAETNNTLVGSVMVGYEGHRGWINYLAVSPSLQRKGIGKALMQAAEELLKSMGCPKINLQVRNTNKNVIAFYSHLGYKDDDVIGMGKRL